MFVDVTIADLLCSAACAVVNAGWRLVIGQRKGELWGTRGGGLLGGQGITVSVQTPAQLTNHTGGATAGT